MTSSTNFKVHLPYSCSGVIVYDDLGYKISIRAYDGSLEITKSFKNLIKYYAGFRSYEEAFDFMIEKIYNKTEEDLEKLDLELGAIKPEPQNVDLLERLYEEAQDNPDSLFWKSAQEIEQLRALLTGIIESWKWSGMAFLGSDISDADEFLNKKGK